MEKDILCGTSGLAHRQHYTTGRQENIEFWMDMFLEALELPWNSRVDREHRVKICVRRAKLDMRRMQTCWLP